jgi:hypothetical protein
MNTTLPFQTQFRPELTLKRKSQAVARPMESDNTVPFEGDDFGAASPMTLQAAWNKLYKARSILEAEQAHLRDDRIALQGELDVLQHREQVVAARELRIQQLELKASLDKADAEDERESASTLTKLTRAPFDMARSVFGQRK